MIKEKIENLLKQAIRKLQEENILAHSLDFIIQVENTKNNEHGDYATNLALVLAKKAGMAPKILAEKLKTFLQADELFQDIQIAGPGFINFFINKTQRLEIIKRIEQEKEKFGCNNIGNDSTVLLEFVSANPTGPLHVGHGRSAAYGASLANVLKANGYKVTKEYYVNDAGRQMDILAFSVWLRYLALCEIEIIFPENGYKGSYVDEIAKEILKTEGKRLVNTENSLPLIQDFADDKELHMDALILKSKELLGIQDFLLIKTYALDSVLKDIKEDLYDFGVEFQQWFSENSLLENSAIEKGISALKNSGYTYQQEGALWFKSTEFGDEKDRVLVRANGNTTYFAADVAYHWSKYDRGFNKIIDIFGADHHGYQARIKAAMQALGHDASAFAIILVQFAILYRGVERVQMSTRSGSFVTLRELREEVGNDAARFFYIMRKPEQHMDFDLDLAKSESSDNPVYYIQYAHARICSVLKQLQEKDLSIDYNLGLQNLSLLKEEYEEELLALLMNYPEVIASAGRLLEPHQIAYYLRELSNGLHRYYNSVTLLCESLDLRSARLCLIKAVRQVLFNGLTLLGVSAPESM